MKYVTKNSLLIDENLALYLIFLYLRNVKDELKISKTASLCFGNNKSGEYCVWFNRDFNFI